MTDLLTGKRRDIMRLFLGMLFICAAGLGIALGLCLAVNHNTLIMDELISTRPALPSRVLDINGELITEFFSDEKREITPLTSLPENQIYAILTREDSNFFKHTGFSLVGFLRAFYRTSLYLITGKGSLQGASTITMQLAGARHADRTDISVTRKLKELWWTYQLERRYTKQEILEQYLNTVYFGHNTYGVESASQFFFGHSAVENTPAESVMLAIQLAGSGLYSPLIKPDSARIRQREILDQMVESNQIDKTSADESYNNYWENFDWSRSSTDSPYFNRLAQDKAPYFSEYIRSEVGQYLFGQQDIYRDGYVIHTTLDLNYQAEAAKAIARGLHQWNINYENDRDSKINYATNHLTSTVEMISLAFNIPGLLVTRSQRQRITEEYLETELTPILDALAMSFGLTNLKSITNIAYKKLASRKQMNNVETALITIDNDSVGYIRAMIGGSSFNRNNQFNRAMDAYVMPGSAFKPLFYSEAISSGKFTPATIIYDGPEMFISPDGTPYTPKNYFGRWNGHVRLREALAKSMNIPALKILEAIGFEAAINRSAALLGITDPRAIAETFERVYPLGLGILSVTPIQLARAYAAFANSGHAVEPIAIRYIEDREGNIIVNPERDLREAQERRDTRVLSAQAAYIMTSLLQSTVQFGTLNYAKRQVEGFDGMPIAGKTGTTQNWTDAWTVGYSPYVTTAMWIGFDKRGNSLGQGQTGATATGPIWAQYMKEIHKNLPRINFTKPPVGIVESVIDVRYGMLPNKDTDDEHLTREVFIAGTEPVSLSPLSVFEKERIEAQVIKIAVDSSNVNLDDNLDDNLESTKAARELFEELGLEPLFLGASSENIITSPSTFETPSSSIFD